MKKQVLEEYISQGYSTYKIAELVGKGQTTVRYWLNKYSLKTSPTNSHHCNKECKLCGRIVSKGFLCNSCRTKVRRHRSKLAAIQYLGGKCNRCGYNSNIAAFEFHHLDKSEKEFNIGNCANKSWDVIKPELDKCELLCSNCHRTEHSSRDNQDFLDAVYNYHGRLLNF